MIRLLPAAVIDQIAAGEVIERPASVVKELVDNAIDAGAKVISVETTGGGRHLIRVVDDGHGMSPADAVKALERHATSKLQAFDDLWGLTTMGFRGEALPAIASVARFTLTSRRDGDLAATRVVIEGGRLIEVCEVGAPVGTTVEVADLLWNVPARLKFLKSEATEAAHVTELVARIAMAYPELHLRLRHNGRTALESPPDRDGFARAQALLGARIATRMVAASGEEGGIRVRCFLGAPELAQTTARGVQLFVGRRPVRDRGILHALAMGYGELVPRGRYPVAVVLVDVPNGAVDINVHPQKSEVRFSEPGTVYAAVRHVIQAGVARAPWRDEIGGAGPVVMTAIASVAPPRLPFEQMASPSSQTYAAQLKEAREREWLREGAQARLGMDLDGPRAWVSSVKDRVRSGRAVEAEHTARALAATRAYDPNLCAHGEAISYGGSRTDLQTTIPDGVAAVSAELRRIALAEALDDAAPHDAARFAHGSAPLEAPGFFGSLRYLGQLDLTYLVCEADGELVLIDQHIAHERVELARLKEQGGGEGRGVGTQRMLFPTTLEVREGLVELATSLAPLLAQVGFEAEAFGATTLALKSVPGGIRHGDPAEVLRDLLEHWADDGAPTEAERLERVLAEIACHSVVRAGDRLSASEAEALLRTMDGADFSTHGPHGRPVVLRLPLAEIARRFGR
ncbi:MAG: DNA mismatch repair endonuclease MutL [Kofleriaceae bacterium]